MGPEEKNFQNDPRPKKAQKFKILNVSVWSRFQLCKSSEFHVLNKINWLHCLPVKLLGGEVFTYISSEFGVILKWKRKMRKVENDSHQFMKTPYDELTFPHLW